MSFDELHKLAREMYQTILDARFRLSFDTDGMSEWSRSRVEKTASRMDACITAWEHRHLLKRPKEETDDAS